MRVMFCFASAAVHHIAAYVSVSHPSGEEEQEGGMCSSPPPAFKDTGEVVFSRFGSWKVCGKFLLKRPLLTQLREPLARRRDPGCALPLRWMTLKQNQLNWRRTQSLSFMCQGEKLLLHPALIGRVGSQLPGNHPAVYGASLTDSC